MRRKRRDAPAKRSPAEWSLRGSLAALCAAAGYVSVTGTLGTVIGDADPAVAHLLAARNGHITADLAEQTFTLQPQSSPNSKAARLARLALRQDATAVEALSVLGLQAQLRNDTLQARRLFEYSQALSQRELRPRIWGIEDAVSRGDIAGALEQYDLALRSSANARHVLFPVLASALAEPKVRAALLDIMAADPIWGESFVNYVAAKADNPQAIISFFREGKNVGLPVDHADRARLVDALAAQRLFDEAWRYYASLHPAADRNRLRDGDFALISDAPTIFDWVAVSGAGVSASIQSDKSGGFFDFGASPSVGGTVLRQTQILSPGVYRLQGKSSGVDQPERSLPYWALTCTDGTELGRAIVPNSAQNGGQFTGSFTVPSGCPVQILSLVVRPSAEITGVEGQIESVRLAPAGDLAGEGR